MEIFKIVTPTSTNITMPSCNITDIECDGIILDKDEYLFQNNVITIKDYYVGKKLIITFNSDKKKFIGYTEKDSVYSYFGNSNLKNNSEYKLSFSINGVINEYTINTELSPLLCKVRDVMVLISPIIENIKENLDIEYEIFLTSLDVTENILNNEKLSEGYSESIVKKLTANIVAYNIVYRYYYEMLEDIGSNESTVGTLSEKKSRYAINLDDLLKRFQRNIDSLEEQLTGVKVPTQSFTKAKNSETGLNARLW